MAAFKPQVVSRNPFGQGTPVAAHGPPAGTFAPGTKVQVGNHRVVIEKYLSEGGFAHVYVVRLPKPVNGAELAVLKRVAVPDKDHLTSMRTEVDTMKRLRSHNHIVKYFDSHASQLKGGGYEVFLLMEYCAGGGLIDFMNTRLQNRLKEPEILKIFSDVAEGVACMHYLRPPLLHRDLKVENILISSSGASQTYKLCDFGSAAPPRPAATTAAEGRLIEDDIQRHTTLQYRSPEMINVYRKQPIDEKSDIWALGVLLYKLCYYTTPFEEVGQMAILNARFKFPTYPAFSDQLKLLIASMLKENPAKRPNIYQVLGKACQMQGKEIPIRDIYAGRSQSESRKYARPTPPAEEGSSTAGAMLLPPTEERQPSIPDIAPMRRGRPTKPVSHHGSAKPSPSPLRMIDGNDPFSSLDGGTSKAGDELSARFPTLDEFSLLTDNEKRFAFEPSSEEKKHEANHSNLSLRVTNALADDAFARPPSPERPKRNKTAPPSSATAPEVNEKKRSTDVKLDLSRTRPNILSPSPQIPSPVSTGTMTSPSSLASLSSSFPSRPIHRFPPRDVTQHLKSQAGDEDVNRAVSSLAGSGSRLANLLNRDASSSQPKGTAPKSPASSRPSLEGSRPAMVDFDNTLSRSRSVNMNPRAVSPNTSLTRNREFERSSVNSTAANTDIGVSEPAAMHSDTNITSDVDFLRSKEEEEKTWKNHKRLGSGSRHGKRASLPSISLSGTKNLLAGRFGDAFRKFEGNSSGLRPRSRSPSPSGKPMNALTPIAGSVATDLSDERHDLDEIEEVLPEVRRELEKRRLEAEENRVAAAAAEYRKRVAEKGGEGGRDTARAVSIQNKVQTLLKENGKPATKTAAGYGRFTDSMPAPQAKQSEELSAASISSRHEPQSSARPTELDVRSAPSSTFSSPPNVPSSNTPQRVIQRPIAPPKPQVLRTGLGSGAVPQRNTLTDIVGETTGPNEDWEANFSKRYPSLSGLEMVETEIETRSVMPLRTKEI